MIIRLSIINIILEVNYEPVVVENGDLEILDQLPIRDFNLGAIETTDILAYNAGLMSTLYEEGMYVVETG